MKKIILSILLIGSVIGSGILLYFKLNTYSIVTITITSIIFLCLIKSMLEEKTPENVYDKTLKNLIKTYEPILVDVEKIPELDVKNIIITSAFEKMVDVQYELKKPIFYKTSPNSCSFILLDTDIAYIFILRVNEDSFSPLDDVILSFEMDAKKRKKDKKILEDIEKTTIIRLDDFREYKISPVRKRDVSNIEEVTIQKDEVPQKETKKSVYKHKNNRVKEHSRKWRMSQNKSKQRK